MRADLLARDSLLPRVMLLRNCRRRGRAARQAWEGGRGGTLQASILRLTNQSINFRIHQHSLLTTCQSDITGVHGPALPCTHLVGFHRFRWLVILGSTGEES